MNKEKGKNMFGKITYNTMISEYESIYTAKDIRTARWIAQQYEGLCTEETTIFSYDVHVVLNSESEETLSSLQKQLNRELEDLMEGREEADINYKLPVKFSLR